MKDINEGLGEAIFLTWSGFEKDLPKVRDAAKRMAANGTTFRGCSYDGRVYNAEHCPVCGGFGLRPYGAPDPLELKDKSTRKEPRKGPQWFDPYFNAVLPAHWQPQRRKQR